MKAFTAVKPTARTLCEYYFEKFPMRVRELRVDTLSQMMTGGNVRPGIKVLVVDDVSGLLLASVLERMRGI